MSTTYVAWNAKSYPWPPPEGWYLASDGRWWAPATGPNPPQGLTPSPTETAATKPAVKTTTSVANAVAAAATEGSVETAAAATNTRSATTATATLEAPPLDNGTSTASPSGADETPTALPDPDLSQPTTGSRAGRRTIIAICIALLALAAAIGALLAMATRDDDTSTQTTDAVEASTTTTSIATTTTTAPSTTTAPPSTTATTTVEAALDIAPDPAQIADYRALLEADGLSAEDLTDADIAEFGSSFCVFALASQDAEGFEQIRAEAIADNAGELTADELALAIDDAITVFCPDQATKLGIS